MAIKLQGLETDLQINTSNWSANIKGAIAGAATLLAGVTALMAGVKQMVDATFEWASEMDGLQDVMGGTNEQAAALNFVLHKSGTETDTLTKGMTILEKGLVEVNGQLGASGKKLAEYGINALDANGKVKDQAALIEEISNKYNSFSTQQERVNFLTEIFGKSGADLIDMSDTLGSEGGIANVTEKVKSLGLAIDPAKYEQFTRTLEEIKLAGLGLAVTVVDKLMPALSGLTNWWTNNGLPSFGKLIDEIERTFELSSQLSQNIQTLTERLHITSETSAAWQGILTATASPLSTLLGIVRSINGALDRLNNLLEATSNLIGIFDALRDAPLETLSIIVNSGRNKRRATGGSVIAGQSYEVNERGTAEIFTPNQSGRIDPQKPQVVEAVINETRLARLIGAELAKALG